MSDDDVRNLAIEFAKRNKNRIARELTDTAKYPPTEQPISVFMSGSPGAGKTEFSKNFIATLEEGSDRKVIRIDADDIRSYMPGYTGGNSNLFQGAVSLIVEKVHDLALSHHQNFIFDGTFSRYEKAVDNINRSLNKGRSVIVFYIYQRPELAWKFTQARETAEGRNIPKDAFIQQFLGAWQTVNRISTEFHGRVAIFIVQKDLEKNEVGTTVKMSPGSQIDDFLQEHYTEEDIKRLI